MPRTQADVDFEKEQSKLATFLAGRPIKPNTVDDDEYMECWRRARFMLKAQELLDACEFALTTFGSLSSEEFAQGGDRIAREHLYTAIASANKDEGFDSQRRSKECRDAVRRSIEINRANVL
jgi:hypothetical protein